MKLWVTQCLLAEVARRYGPRRTTDLLRVEYLKMVPPDTEFLRYFSYLDLYVRFGVVGGRPARMAVRVRRMRPDGTPWDETCRFSFVVPFTPTETYREHVFRLPNVRLTGEEKYAFQLYRRARGWRGPYWRLLAADEFYVMR